MKSYLTEPHKIEIIKKIDENCFIYYKKRLGNFIQSTEKLLEDKEYSIAFSLFEYHNPSLFIEFFSFNTNINVDLRKRYFMISLTLLLYKYLELK